MLLAVQCSAGQGKIVQRKVRQGRAGQQTAWSHDDAVCKWNISFPHLVVSQKFLISQLHSKSGYYNSAHSHAHQTITIKTDCNCPAGQKQEQIISSWPATRTQDFSFLLSATTLRRIEKRFRSSSVNSISDNLFVMNVCPVVEEGENYLTEIMTTWVDFIEDR